MRDDRRFWEILHKTKIDRNSLFQNRRHGLRRWRFGDNLFMRLRASVENRHRRKRVETGCAEKNYLGVKIECKSEQTPTDQERRLGDIDV
jgi:hypothetical protein